MPRLKRCSRNFRRGEVPRAFDEAEVVPLGRRRDSVTLEPNVRGVRRSNTRTGPVPPYFPHAVALDLTLDYNLRA